MELDYRELVIKFFAGEISDSEMEILKSWLSKSSENRKIFDQVNELWRETSIQTNKDHFYVDLAWNFISSKYNFSRNKHKRVTVMRQKTIRLLAAAASVALLVLSGSLGLWVKARQSFLHFSGASTIVSTNFGDKAKIFLPDSSEVILNSGSNIQYDGGYNQKDRIVRLNGEAFFIVRTNPDKPFTVKLDEMVLYATGTRFNVLSYDNENRVETTLEDGELKVLIEGENPINLKSGQQVSYSKQLEKVKILDVNAETYSSWIENKLQLNDTPFEEALRKIARKYNVTFEISNKELLDLKYTATYIDESIEEVMEMLRMILPITYKIHYRATVNNKEYLKPKIVIGQQNQRK